MPVELTTSNRQSSGEDTDLRDVTYILAGVLIPGKSDPASDQAVICQSGQIVYVGSPSTLPSKFSKAVPIRVPYLLPGLWDCHSHFMGMPAHKAINLLTMFSTDPVEAAARATRQVRDTLYAGFTSCVELGGHGLELRPVIEEGSILGPNIYGAGAALSMTAGHGDVFELPLGCVWHKMKPGHAGPDIFGNSIVIADGEDECRKAVRMNLRRGANLIKVFTSGGVTSLLDNPLNQQFSDNELNVIVEEATRNGLWCAAHAIGKAGIMAAIRAGFKVIEHNTYGDDEVVQAMKEKDVMGVFTITPLQSIAENKDKYPKKMYEKAAKIAEAHKASYSRAIKAGVRCALGADLFGGPGSVLSAGMNGLEVAYAVAAGMTPLQAIEAATANGPLTLGPQAPLSGQIKAGYDADFIALEGNPIEDIGLFKEPKNVKWIWKSGKLVKAPGLDPFDALDELKMAIKSRA